MEGGVGVGVGQCVFYFSFLGSFQMNRFRNLISQTCSDEQEQHRVWRGTSPTTVENMVQTVGKPCLASESL